MRTVFKYPIWDILDSEGNFTLVLPANYTILLVEDQELQSKGRIIPVPTVWIELNSQEEGSPVKFQLIGTGQPIPTGAVHIQSFQSGIFVWHMYRLMA